MSSSWKFAACALALAAAAGCNCKSPTEASTISLPAGVLSVQVSGKSTLAIGERAQLTATAMFENGSSQDVTSSSSWVSDASSICNVADGGALTAAAAGSCRVSAVYTNVSGQLGISVAGNPDDPKTPEGPESPTDPDTPDTPVTPDQPQVVSLAVQGPTSLHVGDTAQWQAVATMSDGTQKTVTSSATWASASPAVGSVDGTGLFTASSAGSTNVQAFYGGQAAGRVVTVVAQDAPLPTVTSLTISGTPDATVGSTTPLQAIAHFSDGSSQPVTALANWTSGAPGTATVDGGLVTGVAPGSALITAAYSGKSAQTTVNVTSAPATKILTGIDVTADVDLEHLELGDLAQLHVFAVYSDGSKEDVTSSAAVQTDDSLLRMDGPGLLNVLLTATGALVDPSHVLNVEYGGFTEAVHVNVDAPLIDSLQLGDGSVLFTGVNSKLPAVQALFEGDLPAEMAADFPGLTWNVEPRGPLANVLTLLGKSLNQVIAINNGTVTGVDVPLLNQVLGLLGGSLPVTYQATYNGVTSNDAQAEIGF